MAGKSNKGKNKGRGSNVNSNGAAESSLGSVNSSVPPSNGEANGVNDSAVQPSGVDEATGAKAETTDDTKAASKQAEGDANLYAVSVKTLSGEKLELQLSPGDSVIDVRQFLLDAPETCFFTCYDLVLHIKNGSVYPLEDYSEISEVADITTGGCSLEMIAAFYDDRSIRSHIRRARDLLTLSTLHTSLSTLLALQHDTEQKATDVTKLETPELDGLGFMDDVSGSMHNLVTTSHMEIKCIESIVFSSFNPPPSYRRLVGDLIYIDVVTLEGNKLCITGSTKSFYVNSSIGEVLDPLPAKASYEATTLFGLLQKISPKFKKGFRDVLERKAAAHPFENVQSPLSPNSWLGVYPIPDHKRDAARAEDSQTLSFGSELIGMQRDWNEELQSCRDFPHAIPQERILRDRALYKVTCDFVDAATKGAIGVINRCIPPINPTDPECFHMYVHNNIFFSFAVDSDLGQIFKDDALNVMSDFGAKRSEHLISLPDPSAKASSTFDGTIIDSKLYISKSAVTKEVNGAANLSPDVPIEPQITETEQATYASANNDLKGTRAYQEADVPGLYNLAMAIIDYRGYRVVAQSIIPGILQGDKSDSLLYGSVDNGKKICWDESFHLKVVEAAKRLHLKEHAVLDGSGKAIKLAAPVECKGIVGSDDRQYLLDLMRVTPRDANYSGPGSRFLVLRPELVSSFCRNEAADSLKSKVETGDEVSVAPVSQNVPDTNLDASAEAQTQTTKECVSIPAPSCPPREEILLNPNAFTEFRLAGSEEEIAADESCVRKASSYLIDVILPKFVEDLCALEVSPMDGQTLTDALHAHGINVRYLGKVANMTKNLPHLWDMCTTEIVVRSAKHILKDVLRESPDNELGSAVAHFLNCLFGDIVSVGKKGSPNNMAVLERKFQSQESLQSPRKHLKGQMRWSHGTSSTKSHLSYVLMTSPVLWSYIQEFARVKYQFEVPEDVRLQLKKVNVIRNLCQKVGLTIAARKYNFGLSAPFQTSDIFNLQPVVKHSVPMCCEARDLMDTGKARLSEGMLNEAYTHFAEAFSVLQQVTGPMHREVANCCRYLAMVLYHAGDMQGAILQQNKELIINERCLGLDHPDTAHSYGNMALFYHGLNQTKLALRHMSRTLLILSLSSGPNHPDVAATFINVAMMYQDIGNMSTALRYLQEALKKNERLLGEDHIQTAVCYHALAIAFNCMGAYKLSIQHEKKTYDILVKELGEEDSRTHDSENWMKTFKMREQQANAQKQKGQSASPATTQTAIDLLKAYQAAAAGKNSSTSSANKSISSALIGEPPLPRRRGVDERAAKAAAEVRKKAAAKGLLLRPTGGVPVQPLTPLAQLLKIINSGTHTVDGRASNDNTPNVGTDGPTDTNGSETPFGLGTGLASLDSKKQKSKPKPAS